MALAPTVPAGPGAQGWDVPPKDCVIGWAAGGNAVGHQNYKGIIR